MERSAQDDLAMIRRLMAESRQAVDAGGPHYVIWGLLITAALLGGWAHDTGRIALSPGWIWGVPVGLGWLASTIVGIRTGRRESVRTPGGRILVGIWVGTGAALTLAGFVGTASGALGGQAMLGLTATLLGSALFASSFVVRPTAFRRLAVVWWAGGVLMFLWRDPAAQLLLAGMMVTLLLAPGLWLIRAGRGSARGSRPEAEARTA